MVAKTYLDLFLVITIAFPVAFGQIAKSTQMGNAPDILSRRVMGDEPEDLTTTNAINKALANTKVPGGIIRVRDCTEELAKQRWQPGEASLNDTLNAIVQADPQYSWQLDNGVINILPTAGEPELLKIRIKKFRVVNATSVTLAYSKLMSLPEVKQAIVNLGLPDSFERLQGPPAVANDKTGFSVSCKNVTLREALNAIVRADRKAVWTYSEYHCNGRHGFSIDFTVR
jgi:hypothetical protein